MKESFDLESKLLNNEVKVKAKLGNLGVESTMVADSKSEVVPGIPGVRGVKVECEGDRGGVQFFEHRSETYDGDQVGEDEGEVNDGRRYK